MSLISMKPQVPPKGPIDASIVFVGEAPGRTEELKREPFVGSSGQLLRRLMLRANIIPTHVRITNVIKERPPNNDVGKFIKIGKTRVVPTEEYLAYEAQLKEELEQLPNVNVIVAVGRVALYALCRKTEITKYRGSILESTLIPGKKVIPIIHPAAALRQHIFQYYIYLDLKKIERESLKPDIELPKRNLVIVRGANEAIKKLKELRNYNRVAFDIETINDELACFAIAPSESEAYVFPLSEQTGHLYSEVDEYEIIVELAKLLQDPNVSVIGQNMIFDAGFLFRKYGIRTSPIEDTMILHAILYPELPKGLDFLASVYTNEPYYKDDRKQWRRLDGSSESFWIYNARDAAVTFEVWTKLAPEAVVDDKFWNTYRYQRDLIWPLIYMTERGIYVKAEEMRKASEEAEQTIQEIRKKIEEVAPGINPNSSKDLRTYFYVTKGYKPYVSRSTGAITVNRDALKRLAAKGDKLAALLLDLRKVTKLKSTYLDVKLGEDGRLRAAYNPVGTESGRLSSSKTITGEGTNLQNQPKEMKRFMCADPGYLMYYIDLSQAENRIVAYIAPESKMIEAFESGTDIHSLTASLIFGQPIEEIIREHKEGTPSPIGDGTHTKREWGKRANHGLNYGLGYRTFAVYYEIPERDAKRIVEAYHTAYPGVRKYHEWVRQQLSKDRTLVNLLGRKRVFLDRWGESLFKAAYSFIPQSTVADIINRRGVLYVYEAEPKVELLNQIHDAILIQISLDVPLEEHALILRRIVNSLETPLEAWGRKFVIPAEVEAGFTMDSLVEIDMSKNVVEQLEGVINEQEVE